MKTANHYSIGRGLFYIALASILFIMSLLDLHAADIDLELFTPDLNAQFQSNRKLMPVLSAELSVLNEADQSTPIDGCLSVLLIIGGEYSVRRLTQI